MIEKLYTVKKNQLFFLQGNLSNKFLLDKLDKTFEFGNLVINGHATNRYRIALSEEEISILLDELTLLFTSQGLTNDDEPNRYGQFVEELIDIFSK